MQTDRDPARTVEEVVEKTLELEAEREVSGTGTVDSQAVAVARAELHRWVDSVVGVVAIPGSGRVTLVHENGLRSHIQSPDLPYRLTPPVKFDGE